MPESYLPGDETTFDINKEVQRLEDQHTSGVYPKRPLALVRGEGSWVWDAEGNRYMDMTSGQGVALLGHGHPAVVNAVRRQTRRLMTCPEIFYNDRRAALYRALSRRTPDDLDRFFLCNSGAEAVEAGIKLARLKTGRPGIVATKRGFHGRTLGALSATWKPDYRRPFEPLLPEVHHIPFNDVGAAEEAIDGSTGAVLLEVIQGEGGVLSAEPEFLQAVRLQCDRHGALLIVDEVQTGLGRTGRWFACEHFDLIPDALCLGKGLAGGVPIGALAWKESLGAWPRGSHGSTFGGNPLASAAALATLSTIGAGLPARADRLGAQLRSDLEVLDQPLIREVRGRGLMIGIDLRRRVTPVLKSLLSQGVLALPAGPTVLRLLPPLTVSPQELATARDKIAASLRELGRA